MEACVVQHMCIIASAITDHASWVCGDATGWLLLMQVKCNTSFESAVVPVLAYVYGCYTADTSKGSSSKTSNNMSYNTTILSICKDS